MQRGVDAFRTQPRHLRPAPPRAEGRARAGAEGRTPFRPIASYTPPTRMYGGVCAAMGYEGILPVHDAGGGRLRRKRAPATAGMRRRGRCGQHAPAPAEHVVGWAREGDSPLAQEEVKAAEKPTASDAPVVTHPAGTVTLDATPGIQSSCSRIFPQLQLRCGACARDSIGRAFFHAPSAAAGALRAEPEAERVECRLSGRHGAGKQQSCCEGAAAGCLES